MLAVIITLCVMQLILSMFTYRVVTELGGFLVRQNLLTQSELMVLKITFVIMFIAGFVLALNGVVQ